MLEKLQEANISSVLNGLDMSASAQVIKEPEFWNYYLDIAGREHYRLLAYISSQFSNTNLLDIGTYKGCSALALSLNQSNVVHTIDISNHRTLGAINSNVRIYQDDILKPAYKELILSSPFILLDTFHDGSFEFQFLNYLRELKYQGYLMLDDIFLNYAMRHFWTDAVREEKYDISSLGHHSGTGLVVFKEASHRYQKESYITSQQSPLGFWEKHANRHILNSYRQHIFGRVFDFGCNHGASTYWLKENSQVTEIIGYDLNEAALSLARILFSEVPLPNSFLSRDLADGSLLDLKADTIISFHTLEHIYPQDIKNFLKCAYHALNEGGHFVISIPYDHAYSDPCHVSFFTESGLIQVMEASGFKTIECFKDDRFNEKDLLTGLFKKIKII